MQHRSFIFVAVFVAALIFGAVTVYAYDSSRDDKIANGVTVAGVDVGGLNAQEARQEVSRELSEPLQRPVVVTARGKRFTLSADDAELKADVGGMVDSALEKSRDGNVISRVVRDVRGAEENVDVPPEVTYDKQAVQSAGPARQAQPRPAGPGRQAQLPRADPGQGAARRERPGRPPAAPHREHADGDRRREPPGGRPPSSASSPRSPARSWRASTPRCWWWTATASS